MRIHADNEGLRDFVVSFAIAFSLFMTFLSNGIGHDNVIYGIGQFQLLDNSLFMGNIYMADNVVSPRFIMDHIIVFLMKILSLSWIRANVLILYLGIAMLSLAVSLLSYRLNKKFSSLLTMILSVAIIMNVTLCGVGGFSMFVMGTVGMNLGYAFVIMAISLAVGKNPRMNLSWVFVGIAAFMHIHEGIWGFAIIFLLVLVRSVAEKSFRPKESMGIFVAIVCILIVVVPNMLTDKLENISPEEFTYIYADYRHPHHLIPSSWGLVPIVSSFLLICYPAVLRIGQLCLGKNKYESIRFFTEALFIAGSWFIAILFNYFGVEKFRSATLSTMFISKYLKFIGFMAVIWYLQVIACYLNSRKNLQTLLVFMFMIAMVKYLSVSPFLFCLLVATLYALELYEKKFPDDMILNILFILISLCFLIFCIRILHRKVCAFLLLSSLLLLLSCMRKKYAFVLIVFMIPLSFWGKEFRFKDGRMEARDESAFVRIECGDDIFDMANAFELATGKNESFIADPDDDLHCGWFQLLSKRNCFVTLKNIPSSKKMMKEWYDRHMLAKGLFRKTLTEIKSIMSDNGISYILVDRCNFEGFESDSDFTIFLDSKNQTYRIYKLEPQR